MVFQRFVRTWLLPGVILVASVCPAAGQQRPELGIVEKLGQTVPLDIEVYDETGTLLPLRQVLTKPTILTFVYYRCPGICSPLLTELSHTVDKMDLEPGKDYQILTVSFDPREIPELAASKKASYLASMTRKIDPASWHFCTADSLTIMRFTGAAGFYFKPDGNDFVHATALIVLSPTGKITRYINGIQYLPFDVKMALIEASDGRVSPTIAKILTFCYSYDPEAHTYALNILRIALVLMVIGVALFVVLFLVRPGKKTAERNPRHGQST